MAVDVAKVTAEEKAAGLAAGARVRRREVLLRDSVSFVVLFVLTLALYGMTLFLFRSFERHREELGREYSAQGARAMAAGHPAEAVHALRAALSYAPDVRSYQLQLAEALAQSGKTEEASNYFLALRDARQGDGFINLQLARLDRSKGEAADATEYYRAAIFGDWLGDGILRRREVRLELAQYLLSLHHPVEARTELLLAASNVPETPANDLLFAGQLRDTGDLSDALAFDRKALQHDPKNEVALEQAGRTAFALGQYRDAGPLLRRALAEKPANAKVDPALEGMAHDAERLVDLSLSRELPARERAAHLRAAAAIAQRRLLTCVPAPVVAVKRKAGTEAADAATQPAEPEALVALRARWKTADDARTMRAMQTDADVQDGMQQLIYDTEQAFADPVKAFGAGAVQSTCGAPTGDDALLLQLAKASTQQDKGTE